MAILVPCPCGKKLSTADSNAGKRIKCPACGQTATIPGARKVEEMPVVALAEVDAPPRRGRSQTSDAAEDDKPRSGSRRRGDREPYWSNPGGSDALVALTEDAIYLASLDDKELKQVEKRLRGGETVDVVLKDATTIIDFGDIQKVESNLHHALIDVTWKKTGAWDKTETNILCADQESRDEIMEELRKRLGKGWRMREDEFSWWRAALAPAGTMLLFLFICFCLFMASMQAGDQGTGSRTVRVRGGGQAFFYLLLRFFGPIPTLILGLICVAGCGTWLFFRVRKPPIMLTLEPKKH